MLSAQAVSDAWGSCGAPRGLRTLLPIVDKRGARGHAVEVLGIEDDGRSVEHLLAVVVGGGGKGSSERQRPHHTARASRRLLSRIGVAEYEAVTVRHTPESMRSHRSGGQRGQRGFERRGHRQPADICTWRAKRLNLDPSARAGLQRTPSPYPVAAFFMQMTFLRPSVRSERGPHTNGTRGGKSPSSSAKVPQAPTVKHWDLPVCGMCPQLPIRLARRPPPLHRDPSPPQLAVLLSSPARRAPLLSDQPAAVAR